MAIMWPKVCWLVPGEDSLPADLQNYAYTWKQRRCEIHNNNSINAQERSQPTSLAWIGDFFRNSRRSVRQCSAINLAHKFSGLQQAIRQPHVWSPHTIFRGSNMILLKYLMKLKVSYSYYLNWTLMDPSFSWLFQAKIRLHFTFPAGGCTIVEKLSHWRTVTAVIVGLVS